MPDTGSEGENFSRYPWWRRWFGQRSEKAGLGYLRTLGYRPLAFNWQDHSGEIDLLMLHQQTIVVVEVRSSASLSFEQLARTVNPEKQKRLTHTALRFLHKHKLANHPLRFDVLTIRWQADGEPEFRHYPNAFEATGRFQFHS